MVDDQLLVQLHNLGGGKILYVRTLLFLPPILLLLLNVVNLWLFIFFCRIVVHQVVNDSSGGKMVRGAINYIWLRQRREHHFWILMWMMEEHQLKLWEENSHGRSEERSLQLLFPHLGIPHLASRSEAVNGFKNCHHLFGGNHRKVMYNRCFK